ncbi:MAG: M48 family metallopeptidase [Patescibacteria group bacterium]|nr:M48 family metallopeptidase [Patescibacteria group bacterium]
MRKRIKISDKKIDYVLRTSRRAKRARLSVELGGRLVATRPFGLSEEVIERFIRQKSKWVLSKIDYFKRFKGAPFSGGDEKEYLKNREKALKFARERIAYYNKIYNFNYNKISVKNQKTRWGSCSQKGNLNFNYKIILLPIEMADYIIIHELCHLGELNHSPKFWNLVARTTPNYLEIRKGLRNIRLR